MSVLLFFNPAQGPFYYFTNGPNKGLASLASHKVMLDKSIPEPAHTLAVSALFALPYSALPRNVLVESVPKVEIANALAPA
jgi:hypothetical protein